LHEADYVMPRASSECVDAAEAVNDEISAKFAEISQCMMKIQRNSLKSSDA